jgi:hypothetical protein
MDDSSLKFKTLQQTNQDAHETLNRLTQELIAVASAMSFARSHFSSDDEWTINDEFISRTCAPLENMLHNIATSVSAAKTRQQIASAAMSEYYKTRETIKSTEENANNALEGKSDRS